MKNNTKIFVNLPVKDLDISKTFFSKLGYTFNPQFTDEKAACLIISDSIYFMLVVEKFFKTFTKKSIANASKTTEAIFALAADSRKDVDDIADKAVAAGGKFYNDPSDLGFMYTRSFQDPDDHLWEIFYMDPAHIEK